MIYKFVLEVIRILGMLIQEAIRISKIKNY